jgi:hypothetical protein
MIREMIERRLKKFLERCQNRNRKANLVPHVRILQLTLAGIVLCVDDIIPNEQLEAAGGSCV